MVTRDTGALWGCWHLCCRESLRPQGLYVCPLSMIGYAVPQVSSWLADMASFC